MSEAARGFGPLARALGAFLCRIEGSDSPLLGLSVALLVTAVDRGHTCLDLMDAAGRSLAEVAGEDCPEGRESELLPSATIWRSALGGLDVVGEPGAYRPLVLDAAGRLYLHRYWRHEQTVARAIRARVAAVEAVDADVLRAALDRLFPAEEGPEDWQRAAAAIAALGRFAVVSGGPGTGKTHTLVRIIALIAELEAARGVRPRVALAAPTGKAASRLAEALRAGREHLPPSSAPVLDLIPAEASTIHRLLGWGAGRTRKLPVDLLVVDESSMADVSLVAALVEALPEEARIVLAGDRDQLSSVEAGVVLGDICDTGQEHGYPPEAARRLEAVCPGLRPRTADRSEPPMAGRIAILRRNYRMAEGGELARLATAVNRGDADEVIARLAEGRDATLRAWGDEAELEGLVSREVIPWFRRCLDAGSPAELFAAYNRQAVLCALRRGRAGVESLNRVIASTLRRSGLARGSGDRRWFPGLPVLITVNDYAVRLFNGDIAIVPPRALEGTGSGEGGGLRTCLVPSPDGGYRAVSTARLPANEPAFALTVHKSQGSEFDRVVLVLPRTTTPVLCRELLYTAITRARSGLLVLGTPEMVRATVERRTRRASGLRDLLWAP